MRTLFIAAIFAVAFGLAGESMAHDRLRAGWHRDQTVTVRVGQEKLAPRSKIRIKFLEMIEDSRCPRDVNCIQAGNARIRVRVSGSGRARELILDTSDRTRPASYGGYELTVRTLTPEPRSNIRINRNGYIATISVSRV